MIQEYIEALYKYVPDDARIILCQFRDDPHSEDLKKWRPRVLRRDGNNIDEWSNVYVCISAMRQNGRHEWRRRRDCFAGGLMVMLDDVTSLPEGHLPPTAIIQTSPNSQQYHYFLDRLEVDEGKFDGLIRGLTSSNLLEIDGGGSASITRVCRPPIGRNTKAKYGTPSPRVTLVEADYSRRYSCEQIAEGLGVQIMRRYIVKRLDTDPTSYEERTKAFILVYRQLKELGLLKSNGQDMSGWIEITCPFINGLYTDDGKVIFKEHDKGANNGAAIRVPADENFNYGAFRCHHSHSNAEGQAQQLGWKDLTQWLNDENVDVVSIVNNAAPDSLEDLMK